MQVSLDCAESLRIMTDNYLQHKYDKHIMSVVLFCIFIFRFHHIYPDLWLAAMTMKP